MTGRDDVEVAPGVFVMTSTKFTTTSTIVCRGGNAMLVDPAWTIAELDSIRTFLTERELAVRSGFSTHAHHDHMLWHPAFGAAPRWASSDTVRYAAEWHDELVGMLDDEYLTTFPLTAFPDPFRTLAPVAGPVVPSPFGEGDGLDEAVEMIVHAGHAPGHTALWMAERGVLLAGDMLSDIELPLPFNPDDLDAYLDALDALAPVVGAATMLVPGHGHPTSRPMERLDADRRYLDAIIRGDDPDDHRRRLHGMDEAHRKNVELAAAKRDPRG